MKMAIMNILTSCRSSLTRSISGLGAAALALSLSACGASSTSDSASTAPSQTSGSTLTVSASFYPVQYLAESIGGEHVTVTSVTPTNVEPHDYELSPADVDALGKAKVVLYVKGFQGSLDEAVTAVSGPAVVDLSTDVELVHHEGAGHHHHEDSEDGHHHEDSEDAHHHDGEALDPHFWLDPQRMVSAAKSVEAALSQADPNHAADYQAGLKTLTEKLNSIDTSYTEGLGSCERSTIVTSHAAFGYLADRYKLTQVSISGIDPEAEPSLASLTKVKQVVQDTGTTTIFTEELVSPKTAEAVASETGASTAVLSPMESKPEAGDYAAGMDANLQALRSALSCQ